jgi:FixJ family two-component response regulator
MTGIVANATAEEFFHSASAERAPHAPIAAVPAQSEAAAFVHIADPDATTRQILSGIFAANGYGARSYQGLGGYLDSPRREHVGCLVIDAALALSAEGGFALALSAAAVRSPIVVTAADADVALAVRAMKAGAFHFLEKPLCEKRLLEVVATAMERDRERRADLAWREAIRARYSTLTRREQEVMALVTSGQLNKQAAWVLGLSEITVKVHRGAAMRKMAARTLPELVRMADAIAEETTVTARPIAAAADRAGSVIEPGGRRANLLFGERREEMIDRSVRR